MRSSLSPRNAAPRLHSATNSRHREQHEPVAPQEAGAAPRCSSSGSRLARPRCRLLGAGVQVAVGLAVFSMALSGGFELEWEAGDSELREKTRLSMNGSWRRRDPLAIPSGFSESARWGPPALALSR